MKVEEVFISSVVEGFLALGFWWLAVVGVSAGNPVVMHTCWHAQRLLPYRVRVPTAVIAFVGIDRAYILLL